MNSGVQAVPFPGGSSRSAVPQRPSYGAVAAPPRRGGYGHAPFSFYEALGVIAIPVLAFFTVSMLFLNVFHRNAHAVITLIAVGIGVCIVQIRAGMTHKGSAWGTNVAALTLAALVLSSLVGVIVFENFVAPYRFLHDSNTYTNVLPSESAQGYGDGGKLLFADGSRVEVTKAVGYKDTTIYCVAPVLDDLQGDRLQFWAVGEDCCGQRGSFDCDDAWNPTARGGVVVRRDFGQSRWDTQFGAAVKTAEAAYNISSAEDVLFVRWVKDPELVEQDYWNVARAVMLVANLVFALLAVIALTLLSTALKGFVTRLQ